MSETEKNRKNETQRTVQEPIIQETVVYVGPDLPGIVKRYAVFNHGLPDNLKDYVKDRPVLRSLIIPVEHLAKVNTELAKEGSAFYTLYQKACKK